MKSHKVIIKQFHLLQKKKCLKGFQLQMVRLLFLGVDIKIPLLLREVQKRNRIIYLPLKYFVFIFSSRVEIKSDMVL